MGALAWGARGPATRTARATARSAPPSASTTSPRSPSRSTTTPPTPSSPASGTAERGGLRFGYRYSRFENDVSTLVWDNPFRATDSTDPERLPGAELLLDQRLVAAASPTWRPTTRRTSSSSTAARASPATGGSTATLSYNVMTQDDPLLPYTLNTVDRRHRRERRPFDPTNAANLPRRSADAEVDVTQPERQRRHALRRGLRADLPLPLLRLRQPVGAHRVPRLRPLPRRLGGDRPHHGALRLHPAGPGRRSWAGTSPGRAGSAFATACRAGTASSARWTAPTRTSSS